MADKVCYVYCHYNKINGKSYIGISTKPFNRWGSNGCGYTKGHPCFAKAIKKYGWNNFEHYILEECTFEQAKELEKYYIEKFNSKSPNGYNLTDGGEGVLGYKFDKETIKKMSETHKGRPSNRKGCRLSEQTKLKISKANKGHKWTEEQKRNLSKVISSRTYSKEARENMSKGRMGMKFSAEHIEHLRQSHLGKRPPESAMEKTRKEVCMFSKDGTFLKTFKSISDAVRSVGGSCSSISRVCNCQRKTAKGYIWRWKNVEM